MSKYSEFIIVSVVVADKVILVKLGIPAKMGALKSLARVSLCLQPTTLVRVLIIKSLNSKMYSLEGSSSVL